MSARPALGAMLYLAGGSLLPVMDAVAKHLSASYPVLQIVWARYFFHFLMLLPLIVLRYGLTELWPREPLLQGLRSLFMLAATVLFFSAIAGMPLADAMALVFIAPLVVTVLSAWLLRERVNAGRWIACGIGFAGACIIIRPGPGVWNPAALPALAAGVCYAIYVITTRRLSGTGPPLVTLGFMAVASVMALSVVMPFVWVNPDTAGLALMVAMAVIGGVAHYLIIRAFEWGEASRLAPLGYFELVTATVVGYFVFGDFPDSWTWLGMCVVIASGLYVSLSSDVPRPRPPDAPG